MFAKLVFLFTIFAVVLARPQYYSGSGYSSYPGSYPDYYSGYSGYGYSNPLSYSGYGSYSSYPYTYSYRAY